MKRKVLLYILLALLFTFTAPAQEKAAPILKNSVKINTIGLVLHNVSLLYERQLNDHWTLQAGTGYRWGVISQRSSDLAI